jgi:hypothetical protein
VISQERLGQRVQLDPPWIIRIQRSVPAINGRPVLGQDIKRHTERAGPRIHSFSHDRHYPAIATARRESECPHGSRPS